jgi:hypothetical protein
VVRLSLEEAGLTYLQDVNLDRFSPDQAEILFTTVATSLKWHSKILGRLDSWHEKAPSYFEKFFEFILDKKSFVNFCFSMGVHPTSDQLHRALDLFDPGHFIQEQYETLVSFITTLERKTLNERREQNQTVLTKFYNKWISTARTQEFPFRESFSRLERLHPELHWERLKSEFLSFPNVGEELALQTPSGVRELGNFPYSKLSQLYPAGRFNPRDNNHNGCVSEKDKKLNGSHLVGFLQNEKGERQLCFKHWPEFPVTEQAIHRFMNRLFYYPGTPSSEIIRVGNKGQLDDVFLVSAYIEGYRLDVVLEEALPVRQQLNEHQLNQVLTCLQTERLDSQRVGELLIMSMLTNPEDGRAQNYIVTSSDLDPNLFKIVAIDSDHSFSPAIPQEIRSSGWFGGSTIIFQGMSDLFKIPFMNEPLHSSISERLIALDVNKFFNEWLDDLEKLETDYSGLFYSTDKKLYGTTMTLEMPLNYARLRHVYNKLQELQSFLKNRKEAGVSTKYIDVLLELEESMGNRYAPLIQSSDSLQERHKKSGGSRCSLLSHAEFAKALGRSNNPLLTIQNMRESLKDIQDNYSFSRDQVRFSSFLPHIQERNFGELNKKIPQENIALQLMNRAVGYL